MGDKGERTNLLIQSPVREHISREHKQTFHRKKKKILTFWEFFFPDKKSQAQKSST